MIITGDGIVSYKGKLMSEETYLAIRAKEEKDVKTKNVKLSLVEITKDVFDEISNQDGNYFQNSCIFDDDTDNLLSFMDLDFSFYGDNNFHYFRIDKKR